MHHGSTHAETGPHAYPHQDLDHESILASHKSTKHAPIHTDPKALHDLAKHATHEDVKALEKYIHKETKA